MFGRPSILAHANKPGATEAVATQVLRGTPRIAHSNVSIAKNVTDHYQPDATNHTTITAAITNTTFADNGSDDNSSSNRNDLQQERQQQQQ